MLCYNEVLWRKLSIGFDELLEFERFLIEMMKYNNSNSYYEIDDDLFDMCVFDDDGNLLDIDFDKI